MFTINVRSGYTFSTDFFNDLSANQNPLIGATRQETTVNCVDVQTLIAHLETTEHCLLPSGAGHGLFLTMECVKGALFFDEHYRDFPEKLSELVHTVLAPDFMATFFAAPLPNQSPLIGSIRGDTTSNCTALLALLAHLETNEEVFLTEGAGHGLYLMTICVKSALYFEDNYRDFIEAYGKLDQVGGELERLQQHEETTINQQKATARQTLNTSDSEPNTSGIVENTDA
jgi:hypothetical protein